MDEERRYAEEPDSRWYSGQSAYDAQLPSGTPTPSVAPADRTSPYESGAHERPEYAYRLPDPRLTDEPRHPLAGGIDPLTSSGGYADRYRSDDAASTAGGFARGASHATRDDGIDAAPPRTAFDAIRVPLRATEYPAIRPGTSPGETGTNLAAPPLSPAPPGAGPSSAATGTGLSSPSLGSTGLSGTGLSSTGLSNTDSGLGSKSPGGIGSGSTAFGTTGYAGAGSTTSVAGPTVGGPGNAGPGNAGPGNAGPGNAGPGNGGLGSGGLGSGGLGSGGAGNGAPGSGGSGGSGGATAYNEPTSFVPPVGARTADGAGSDRFALDRGAAGRLGGDTVYRTRRPVTAVIFAVVSSLLMVPVLRLLVQASFVDPPLAGGIVPAVLMALGLPLTGFGLYGVAGGGGAMDRTALLRPPAGYLLVGLVLLLAAGLATA